jgi:CBS domain-containing membrane protein
MLNCLHPPSGAVALTAVLGGPAIHDAGYWFALSPIALNSVILLSVALFFNNVTGRRYPHLAPATGQPVQKTSDPLPGHRIGPGESDIAAAIQDFDEVVPVSPDDLDLLFHKAQIRAFERQAGGVTCADVMSRDVLSVETGASLKAVWRIFMTRHIKALPVTDDKGHLVGIVSLDDFLENSVLSGEGTLRLGFGHTLIARCADSRFRDGWRRSCAARCSRPCHRRRSARWCLPWSTRASIRCRWSTATTG